MFCTCQPGFENLLQGEMADAGLISKETGPGWVLTEPRPSTPPVPDLAFTHLMLQEPVEIRGESVNALAQQLLEFFIRSLGNERVEAAWPCLWLEAREPVGLSRRSAAVEQAFGELLRKRFSRVARLTDGAPPWGVGPARGLFVRFTDFGRAFAARDAVVNGPRRMADDPQAPSRSYLKVEEAYGLLGREPQPGETVADLGAAPGGWSYSAAKRGARVLAIDNGPLKGGARDQPQIEHRCADAFRFCPEEGSVFDWLFSDLLEEPHQVLKQIAEPWLAGRWCRRFVINLKFGRVDPTALLRELREPGSVLSLHASDVRIRHLYHDREEFTVAGRVGKHEDPPHGS
jgi:23S rRNA (cytidine2498-2'-O)-methyltransferase